MHPELDVWIDMFRLLCSELYRPSTVQLLEKAGACESTYEVMALLDGIRAEWQSSK